MMSKSTKRNGIEAENHAGDEQTRKKRLPNFSNYADPGNRQYSPWYSVSGALLIYGFYLFSSMLPLIVPLFCYVEFYLKWIPVSFLKVFATAIALDFVVPLGNGYRPNQKFKKALTRLLAEGGQLYFPAKSLFLPGPQLSKDKAYILAAYPHGLFGGGNHFGFADFEDMGVYPIYSGANVMRYVPFVRRFLTTMGFTSVTKQGLRRVLDVRKYGPTYPYNVVHLVVGGINEMFYTPGSSSYEQIILSKRKGFIKLALQTGADIIPLYSFGANQTYYRIAGPHSWLCKISTALRVSITPWLGRWWIPLGVIPFQYPIMTVTGDVFSVPKVEESEVTDELVEKVHADFCQALRSLFDRYKKVYVEQMGADQKWLTRELKWEDE